MAFIVGDKVRCIKDHDANGTIVGKIGIIRKVTAFRYLVYFTTDIRGHGENHRCWNIPQEGYLILEEACIPPKPMTKEERVEKKCKKL